MPELDNQIVTDHLAEVNKRLPGATPHAAHCLGLLSTLVLYYNVLLPAYVLDGALNVKSFEEGVRYARGIWELKRA